MTKSFTAAEIAKHDTHEDCWIIVRKKVYDVTRFLDDHPGGGEVIVEQGGADSTNAFEGVGHSEQAKRDLEKYYIGDLAEEESAPPLPMPLLPPPRRRNLLADSPSCWCQSSSVPPPRCFTFCRSNRLPSRKSIEIFFEKYND
eukprot:TRINITY_DN1088_c0_g1_i1.p1 TRINITY_DN1088_c0_g1~~TRINITY_DN1088_c0_g1_i1.p1  ORF type:complete len:143 (-),score=30.84 TRINITY_DN1088_c0_g1_i1:29-457(-)